MGSERSDCCSKTRGLRVQSIHLSLLGGRAARHQRPQQTAGVAAPQPMRKGRLDPIRRRPRKQEHADRRLALAVQGQNTIQPALGSDVCQARRAARRAKNICSNAPFREQHGYAFQAQRHIRA